MSSEIKNRDQMRKRLQDEFLINVGSLSRTLGITENRLLDNFLQGLIHYDEPLEYILRQIPDQIKTAIIQEMA